MSYTKSPPNKIQPVLILFRDRNSTPFTANARPNRLLATQCYNRNRFHLHLSQDTVIPTILHVRPGKTQINLLVHSLISLHWWHEQALCPYLSIDSTLKSDKNSYNFICMSSQDSGKSVHPHSLISLCWLHEDALCPYLSLEMSNPIFWEK